MWLEKDVYFEFPSKNSNPKITHLFTPKQNKDIMSEIVGELHLICGAMCAGKSTELLRRLMRYTATGSKVVYVNHQLDTRSKGPYSTHNKLYKEKVLNIENMKFTSVAELKSLMDKDSDITLNDFDVIGIDESQFYSDLKDSVTHFVEKLGKYVIVSGLTNDFKRNKFGQILDLEPIADSITKLTALCKRCSSSRKKVKAIFSHRIIKVEDKERDEQNSKDDNQVKVDRREDDKQVKVDGHEDDKQVKVDGHEDDKQVKVDGHEDDKQVKVGSTDEYMPLCRKCYLTLNK